MFGAINLFKPRGLTSRDCVNRLQRLVYPAKIGHAGTLDPLAEGVLIVLVGSAVRLVDWFHELPKAYLAEFELGKSSLSADLETDVEILSNPVIPLPSELEAVVPKFVGTIQQVPPIYSAIQVNGKRAHQLARRGKDVNLAARPVTVHHLKVIEYNYPKLKLDIGCGTGTYVRSLGRDIAQALSNDAVMTDLSRTSIGNQTLTRACPLEVFDSAQAIRDNLLNPVELLDFLPRIELTDHQIQQLTYGEALDIHHEDTPFILGVDSHFQLRSILVKKMVRSAPLWAPHRNFLETP
jgi:tRNA pseudouridine55 synthase